MAEVRKGEEFLSGFLGSLAQRQEEVKKQNTLTPENQLKLLELQSEGRIEKAPFANNPQGAVQYIGQMLGLSGKNPMDQYRPSTAEQLDWRQVIGNVTGRQDINQVIPIPLRDQGKATTWAQMLMPRKEFGGVQGFTEDGDPVEYEVSKRQWFVGGKPVAADQVGRLISKTRPQMSSEQINEVTNLLNAKNQLASIDSLFAEGASGPIEGRMYQASKSMGIDFGSLRGMASLTDDKVRLRTIMGSAINDYIKAITGAQMSEPEARRIMSVMPDPNAADAAFLPALQEIQRITNEKLDTRLAVLESQGTVGINKLKELSNKKRKPKPTTDPNTGGAAGVANKFGF